MGEPERSSRECRFGELRSDIVSSIREYASERSIAGLETALYCCETVSESQKKGRLASLFGGDRDPTNYIGVVLTPGWLIWGRSGPRTGTVVQGAALKDLSVTEYDSHVAADVGIKVTGIINGSTKPVEAFIGLGQEEAAEGLRKALRTALRAASNEPRDASSPTGPR